MNKNYPLSEIQGKISTGQKIVLALPSNPTYDQVASALGLSLSLSETGKQTEVICPTPMTVEFNRLVGVDKISGKTKGRDLVISLNYSPEQVEKVSYNDDSGRPNIVIQPKTSAPALNESLVSFSYAGSGEDLLFLVGIKDAGQLSLLGLSEIPAEKIISINTEPGSGSFSQINIIDGQASSVSEIVLGLISGLNLPLSQDTAQNLLSGIWQKTRKFTDQGLGADAYEAVAICLRAGAQKPTEIQANPRLEEKPIEKLAEKPEEKPEEKPVSSTKPPADWFEPKIFKGSSIA